jgi:hypothetical protein
VTKGPRARWDSRRSSSPEGAAAGWNRFPGTARGVPSRSSMRARRMGPPAPGRPAVGPGDDGGGHAPPGLHCRGGPGREGPPDAQRPRDRGRGRLPARRIRRVPRGRPRRRRHRVVGSAGRRAQDGLRLDRAGACPRPRHPPGVELRRETGAAGRPQPACARGAVEHHGPGRSSRCTVGGASRRDRRIRSRVPHGGETSGAGPRPVARPSLPST